VSDKSHLRSKKQEEISAAWDCDKSMCCTAAAITLAIKCVRYDFEALTEATALLPEDEVK
jgi:hypothetical protein